MNKVKRFITRLPAWMLTAVMTLIICWLTLSPKPLGDTDVNLFPHADKLAHAAMFGMLTACIMLDRQRKSRWAPVSVWMATLAAAVSSGVGTGIEFMQELMGLGRSFEASDMIADAGGSIIAAQLYVMMQPKRNE